MRQDKLLSWELYGSSCDTLWLPTFVLRNVNELPQGRVQPAYITVDSKGIVTWRVQFTGVFYTPMRLKAFVSLAFWLAVEASRCCDTLRTIVLGNGCGRASDALMRGHRVAGRGGTGGQLGVDRGIRL